MRGTYSSFVLEHSMQLTLIDKSLVIDNVWKFVFEPTEPQEYTPGEYVRVKLDHENPDDEGPKRFFTNSAPPYEGVIQITTRVTDSTFKQALHNLPVGDDSLEMIKPHEGDFVWEDTDKPIIFVAAGIGVTPYYSILLQRVHDGNNIPATLLYAGRNELLPWRQEFAALEESNPEFKVEYQIGEHITAENLQKQFPDLNNSVVYLSGPEAMVDEVGEQLKSNGLPEEQLKQDWFPNYDDSSY